jgi:hypothetical protein
LVKPRRESAVHRSALYATRNKEPVLMKRILSFSLFAALALTGNAAFAADACTKIVATGHPQYPAIAYITGLRGASGARVSPYMKGSPSKRRRMSSGAAETDCAGWPTHRMPRSRRTEAPASDFAGSSITRNCFEPDRQNRRLIGRNCPDPNPEQGDSHEREVVAFSS